VVWCAVSKRGKQQQSLRKANKSLGSSALRCDSPTSSEAEFNGVSGPPVRVFAPRFFFRARLRRGERGEKPRRGKRVRRFAREAIRTRERGRAMVGGHALQRRARWPFKVHLRSLLVRYTCGSLPSESFPDPGARSSLELPSPHLTCYSTHPGHTTAQGFPHVSHVDRTRRGKEEVFEWIYF